MKQVVVTLMVVAGLVAAFFAVDDFMRTRIQNGIADQILAESGATAEVEVTGVPVLRQVLAGRLDEVHVTVPTVTMGGVTIEQINVTGTGVSTAEPYVADSLEATAIIPMETIQAAYAQSTSLDGVPNTSSNVMESVGNALGLDFAMTFTPTIREGSIVLRLESLQVGGRSVDVSSLSWLLGDVVNSGDITIVDLELPEGISADEVVLTDAGAEVRIHGDNVSLAAVQ